MLSSRKLAARAVRDYVLSASRFSSTPMFGDRESPGECVEARFSGRRSVDSSHYRQYGERRRFGAIFDIVN
jgi:hypothetical protein